MKKYKHDDSFVIGYEIPWDVIRGGACKVKSFTPFATLEAGKVKDVQPGLPLGSLTVKLFKLQDIELPNEASMPIIHKDDFLRIWHVFKERGVNPGEEVIVFYEPFYRNKLAARFAPTLHIYIFPEGFHDGNEHLKPIAIFEPKYYKYHR